MARTARLTAAALLTAAAVAGRQYARCTPPCSPGDNLFTNSIIAFDPDDGRIKWHYQTTPHDVWDYDGVNEQILFDQDGRKLLAHFDRNGYSSSSIAPMGSSCAP